MGEKHEQQGTGISQMSTEMGREALCLGLPSKGVQIKSRASGVSNNNHENNNC